MSHTLTLQIRKENFDAILRGEQREENRWVYPSNKALFFEIKERRKEGLTPDQLGFSEDEEGNLTFYFDTLGTILGNARDYDYLRLINGRRKDAPELTVEVISITAEVNADENDLPYLIEDTYRGEKVGCIALGVTYELGKVIESKNIK